MWRKYCISILFILIICFIEGSKNIYAQKIRGINDTILTGAIVVDNDTFAHILLRDVTIWGQAPKWAKIRKKKYGENDEAYANLRYNVYVVYPYAVAASMILNDIDSVLNSIYSKDAKQAYKRRKETELNKKFKDELENLSITQGQILVKLIARETGKPCYQIVRELKGGINAALWQTVALLFNNNLRNHYNPDEEDAAIESVVREILSKGHFERKSL